MDKEPLTICREGEFSYPIYFDSDFDSLGKALEQLGCKDRFICIITDSNVAPLYLGEVKRVMQNSCARVASYVFPAGEANKTLQVVQDIYTFLIREGMDRTGILAALGGGVTGDLTGFAAATYLRGIDFIQIPTTLLAQADSSVGGKTGVDFDSYKNMVGAFYQPRLVYMNLSVLATLSEEQFACGMGEVLKSGLICDADFFHRTDIWAGRIRARDPEAIAPMIRRCVQIKAEIVQRDPTEKGDRALLNLGHTVGHAIEKLKKFQLLHGQCVAVGLAAAAWISVKRGLMSEQEMQMIESTLQRFALPVSVEGLDPAQVLSATKKDKKMQKGRIRFILMRGIGQSFTDLSVTDEELMEGIRHVCR
ncbi:MAG: 3-dehydroquinate synthase [Blautia sp.]|nr:3-dehydroquinate synthase [Blautia sp.]